MRSKNTSAEKTRMTRQVEWNVPLPPISAASREAPQICASTMVALCTALRTHRTPRSIVMAFPR
jgi:hypothetical protein